MKKETLINNYLGMKTYLSLFLLFLLFLIFISNNGLASEPPRGTMLVINSEMHTGAVTRIATDAENRFLVTASIDKTLRLWELPSGKLIQVLRPPFGNGTEGRLDAVAISPDGQTIACGGWTGWSWDKSVSIYFFDRKRGKMNGRISGHPDVISHLVYSKDGHFLVATIHGMNGIRVYRVEKVGSKISPRLMAEDKKYGSHSYGADFDQKGNLVTTSMDGFIRLYDANFRLVTKRKSQGGLQPYSISFSPDGLKIAVGFLDSQKVDILSSSDLSYIYSPDTLTGVNKDSGFPIVTWSSDGQSIYAGGLFYKLHEDMRYFIRKWLDSGRGGFTDILSSKDRITHMLPLKSGGIVYSAAEPAFGVIDKNDNISLHKSSSGIDYSGWIEGFFISYDGSIIQFPYKSWSKSYLRFSVSSRLIESLDDVESPKELSPPIRIADGINITDWVTNKTPKLNGKTINLNKEEYATDLAISPNGKTFALATAWRILLFDREGREVWKVIPDAAAWAMNISGDNKYLVVVFDNGIIRWLRMEDGKLILSLFPHRDKKQWVLWTPEGYFDASIGVSDLIGYQINQGKDKESLFISLNNLYDVFYRPDIVATKFKGEDINSLVTITVQEALKNPPPSVQFTSIPSDTHQVKANICYQANSNGGGIGEVRLFHNGKLIKSDGFYREIAKTTYGKRQLSSLDGNAINEDMRSIIIKSREELGPIISKSKGEQYSECTEIDIVPGDNDLSITAFNHDNTIQSYMETVSFKADIKQEDPHLYMLIVGIDRYIDQSVNLKYAVKDASDIINKLVIQSATLYKPRNIHAELIADSIATKYTIQKKISELAFKIKPSDSFIFFVAGHGVLFQNQYFMLTHDFDGRISAQMMISSNEIVEMSKKIKSLNQLFVFDTCHAGGVDYIVSGLYDARMSVLAKKMGLHIYASASDKQAAMDGYKGNGLFTYNLMEGLNNRREADGNSDGKVSIAELGEYSKQATSDISKKIGHQQIPLIINFGKDSLIYKLP